MVSLVDVRGEIEQIAEGEFRSVQVIRTKAGSVRSNHWHRRGGHVLHVLSGMMKYAWRGVDETQFQVKDVHAGESVLTGPLVVHVTTFPVDTVMVCCSTLPRDRESYEVDTVRV